MSLTNSQWRQIVDISIYLPQDLKAQRPGRYVSLDKMQDVLRKSKRSLPQNALIHVLFDETIRLGGEALGGWTREDVKEWALGEFWGWDEVKALGRTRLRPKRRSSSMTKTEATDFAQWYVATMNGHGIPISLPEAA